jgi:hypothetical protein
MTCTYRRRDGRATPHPPSIATEDHSNLAIVDTTKVGSNCDYGRVPIDFLVDFIDPSAGGTTTAVAADILNQNIPGCEVDSLSPPLHSDDHATYGEIPFWGLGEHLTNLVDIFTPEPGERYSFSQYDMPLETQEEPALQARMRERVSQLCATHSAMSRSDVEVHETFNTQLAESVFTPSNLKRFITAYLHDFYAYLPIVHRSTFDAEKTSLPLLTAVFLFGSQCSVPVDPALSAQCFFDTAEEYIFSHSTFRRLLRAGQGKEHSVDDVEAFQAALIMQIVQNIKNDTRKRRRSRLERYPCLVTAMRCSGLFGARRQSPESYISGSDWGAFILDETRVRFCCLEDAYTNLPLIECIG